MRMAAALSLTLALGACVQPAPNGAGQGAAATPAPLRVSNGGQPFAMSEGAAARKAAEAACASGGKQLRPSIYDWYDDGEWVFVGGCA